MDLLNRTDYGRRWQVAQEAFDARDYLGAVAELEGILTQQPDARHGLGAVQLLLARSYYHSAQLRRAEQAARDLLRDEPTNGYAALLLGRSLQRQSRHEEAKPFLALAQIWDVA